MRLRRLAACAAAIVLCARPAAAQVTSSISGTVFDSVSRRHLGDAIVQIARVDRPTEARSVRSGADGTYRFDGLTAGAWLLGFFHPVLDSLGLQSPLLRVTIADSAPVRAMLAIPAPQSIVQLVCGRDSTTRGLWQGRVRDARTGAPVDSATVVAQWSVIVASGNTIARHTPGVIAATDAEGRFALCQLPTDEMVVMRAWKGDDSTGTTMTAMPDGGLLVRDLLVAPTQLVQRTIVDESSGQRDTAVVPVLVGGARVQGRVTRSDGRAVSGARVRLADAGIEATTNTEGYYALDSLPLGTRLIDARAIGFLPVTRIVDLLPTTPVALDVVLESRQTFLDTVKVLGDRVYDSPQYRDFLERKKSGFGYYADEQDLERLEPMYLSEIVRRFPGITVRGTPGNSQIFMRSPFMQNAGMCRPVIFLDGAMMAAVDGFSPDFLVAAQAIRGVEVYTRASGMPAQYQTMSGCGSIVVWTGRRRIPLPP